ncbi:MAG TPA: hypothetical protein VD970_18530 [Acetobacteraceae bacterium]|nr:hypothetical protein [Acetobacteraceae bacterium]
MSQRDSWRDRLEDVNAGRAPREFESAVAHLQVGRGAQKRVTVAAVVATQPPSPRLRNRLRWIRLLIPLAVIGVLALVFPLGWEGRRDACAAFENRLFLAMSQGGSLAPLPPDLRHFAAAIAWLGRRGERNGSTVRAQLRSRLPAETPWLFCLQSYWRVILLVRRE